MSGLNCIAIRRRFAGGRWPAADTRPQSSGGKAWAANAPVDRELNIPPAQRELVPRPHLIERLNQGLGSKLILGFLISLIGVLQSSQGMNQYQRT